MASDLQEPNAAGADEDIAAQYRTLFPQPNLCRSQREAMENIEIIQYAKADGRSVRSIWRVLRDAERVSVSYSAFLSALHSTHIEKQLRELNSRGRDRLGAHGGIRA